MSLKLNSPEQLEFYEELKKESKLVDFYSENHKAIIESYGDDWLKELDEEHGPVYRNHMLMAQVIRWPEEQFKKLLTLFPSLKKQYESDRGHPSILFINLAENKILWAGLGRKNNTFIIDSETNESVKPKYQEVMPTEYLKNFYKLDHHRFVADALEYLETFATSHYEWACFEDEEDIQALLELEPDKDGQYRFEYEDEDDEGHSKEELEGMLEEMERLDMYMDDAKDFYLQFFPKMEFYELSPGNF